MKMGLYSCAQHKEWYPFTQPISKWDKERLPMQAARKKVTTRTLVKMKQRQEPIAMITAYDYPSAKCVDQAGADIILVGDTLGMVVLGYDSTIPVTMEEMVHHTKAVVRGTRAAMVIADIPFLVAHLSRDEVMRAAGRLMQAAGAYGVKIEGRSEIFANIKALTAAGVPVMGHLGLTPQAVNQLGGYLIQAKEIKTAQALLDEARRFEEAGIFALVLECVPEEVAQWITEECKVPVIGIGAGRFCDGQVLVFHDVLAMSGEEPPLSFVKVYQALGKAMIDGIASYVHEVKQGLFPEAVHASHVPAEWIDRLRSGRKGEV
jgi:3-methyl-2-oxobutanoate hydroxymethyltransferase